MRPPVPPDTVPGAQFARIWAAILHQPGSALRVIEMTCALCLITLAVFLRWGPLRPHSGGGWRQAARDSTRWLPRPRRPDRRQTLSAVLTGCAVGFLIGGSTGVTVGTGACLAILCVSSRRISERELRARRRLTAAAPPAVDLFAAALAAGLLPSDAAIVVATAFEAHGPEDPLRTIAGRFAEAATALREGAEPEAAWRPLMVDGATAAVGAAALRSSRTGAPASLTVAKAARDLWGAAEHAAQAQIRAVAVRAVAPLALCFLPAFVVLGILPTAIGLLAELQP
jgi:hypothetical protein